MCQQIKRWHQLAYTKCQWFIYSLDCKSITHICPFKITIRIATSEKLLERTIWDPTVLSDGFYQHMDYGGYLTRRKQVSSHWKSRELVKLWPPQSPRRRDGMGRKLLSNSFTMSRLSIDRLIRTQFVCCKAGVAVKAICEPLNEQQ